MTGIPNSEIRMTRYGALLWLALVWFTLRGLAQEELPKLLPPQGEIPPTFWELHGTTVMVSVTVALLLLSVGIWWLLRPKPVVPLPPEVQARMALEPLLKQPEDGAVISRATQILRRYVQSAFELPAGEPTTAEFCAVIAQSDQVGNELATELADLMRECDARKFALKPLPELGAARQALHLVERAERRKIQVTAERNQAA